MDYSKSEKKTLRYCDNDLLPLLLSRNYTFQLQISRYQFIMRFYFAFIIELQAQQARQSVAQNIVHLKFRM